MLRRIIGLALGAGLISALGLALFAWHLGGSAPTATPPALTPLPTHWVYRTEQEWIVAHVVQPIVCMAHYARTGKALDPTGLDVEVTTNENTKGVAMFTVRIPGVGKPTQIVATDYIWSPGVYAPLVTELLGPLASDLAAPANLQESTTFAALTRPRTDIMAAESRRVSSVLAARMTDVAAHEDAALLFATLGLREWSGKFYDNHRTLCRLASHLAMASALRRGAGPGPSARVAEAVLLTLAFRDQQGTLERVDRFGAPEHPSSAAQAWARTLRMRNTEDWRLLPDPRRATLLERREYLIWLAFKRGMGQALEFIDQTDLDGISDWGTILLSGGFSVEAGNRFVPQGLTEVLGEAGQVPLDLGDGTDPARVVRALNEEPTSGPVRLRAGRTEVEVMDSGTWAFFFEKQILMHVESGVDCMLRMLGQPEQGNAYRAQMEKAFGGLRQFPLAALRMAKDDKSYGTAQRASLELLAATPEWVGGLNWDSLLTPPPFRVEPVSVPQIESWSQPLFPRGTYFEWPKRLRRHDGHLRVRGAALQQMRQDLPYYSLLAEAAVDDRFGPQATAADLRNAFGPLLDYDVRLMIRVANAAKDDPAEYKRLYRRIGELDPDRLNELGQYLVDRGEAGEAAAVYEQYVAQARDRVNVCNSVDWLVNYDEDQGKTARALELAQDAAAVYCYDGLLTLANLYERRREWTKAQEYVRRIAERYDDERLLFTFYLRHQRTTGQDTYRSPREGLQPRFFPKGLEPFGVDPSGAPDDGVVLLSTSVEASKAGLRMGDIIVGLDGFRIRNYDQYRVILGLTRKPQMDLVIWRGQYLHLSASPPKRLFGVGMNSYVKPART